MGTFWDFLTVERSLVCDIVNKKNTHSPSIVGCRDGSKPLLPRCIPYLKLDPLTIQFDSANFEVNANGSDKRWCKRVFTESQKAA